MKSRIGFEFSQIEGVSFRTYNALLDKANDWELFNACKEDVDAAVDLAWNAWPVFRSTSLGVRALLLRKIADLLGLNKQGLISIYCAESNLSEGRAISELTRTQNQLLLMADFIETNFEDQDTKVDDGKSLRRDWIGIGPVVVFGASNFPFAYSTIGGDSVAALAAGCPVIVKAHPYHGGTSWQVAEIVNSAIKELGLPDGCFSHLLDDGFEIGTLLVQNPKVKAVGFTGSISGGEAIIKLANERKQPIPMFAEMGSVNPVVVLDSALKEKERWTDLLTQSISNDAGQFCTKPGLIIIPKSKEGLCFGSKLTDKISLQDPKVFVHPNVFKSFKKRVDSCFEWLDAPKWHAQPVVRTLSVQSWLSDKKFREEFFGPQAIILYYEGEKDLEVIFNKLEGQLTFTLLGQYEDPSFRLCEDTACNLAGRIVLNDVPTGVLVAREMVHGGTYPAASDSRFTAVGPTSVFRFLRPITRQNWQ